MEEKMTDITTQMTEQSDDMTKRENVARTQWKRFAPIAIVIGGLIFAYAMGWQRFFTLDYLAESREVLKTYVADNYLLSLGGFAALYTIAVAFAFPAASILTIFGGFLFGWLIGGIVIAFGATLGAAALFVAARSAFGDFLRSRVGGKRIQALADGFEKDAFGYLLVLRLAPVFPFFLMNIAPALFNVPLRAYVAATFLGILPGTFAYTFLGQGVESVLIAAESAGTSVGVADLVTPQITIAFAALAIVAAIPTIIRKWRERAAS